ncbi:MAG: FxLYD domain-containing protein, partial [Pseudomonas sp.]|uniref:FxLYD domain-containing protein n=1 Tax=Pseudomonas sp. TaxID=306 RepID=UPI003BB7AA97
AHGGQAYVGGTLVNRGDAPVSHGYVVVTLIDAQCRPQESVLGDFGAISQGESREFRVPLEWKYQRYRITALAAFDGDGATLLAVDDNAALLQSREADERAKCVQLRQAAATQL